MFGIVTTAPETLPPEERERYRAVYCGLCRSLGERAGQLARMGLTYDMAFLALLLSSLYEPPEETRDGRCLPHPMHSHPYVRSVLTDYAADMTVVLVYHKCLDDWTDDRSLAARSYAAWLKRRYGAVQKLWPRQCAATEAALTELHRIEAARGAPDQALNSFGMLLGDLFVWRQDEWSRPLRQFGTALGRFIYFMDAALDYEKDKSSGSYNPLCLLGKTPAEMQEPLTVLIGQAAEIFECLPLEQDLHLLRTILYGGVWQKYHAAARTKERKDAHGTGSL